mgnify:CR=1 FL=1
MTALAKRMTVTCFTGFFCLSALFADKPNISSSSPDLQRIFDNVGPAVKTFGGTATGSTQCPLLQGEPRPLCYVFLRLTFNPSASHNAHQLSASACYWSVLRDGSGLKLGSGRKGSAAQGRMEKQQ